MSEQEFIIKYMYAFMGRGPLWRPSAAYSTVEACEGRRKQHIKDGYKCGEIVEVKLPLLKRELIPGHVYKYRTNPAAFHFLVCTPIYPNEFRGHRVESDGSIYSPFNAPEKDIGEDLGTLAKFMGWGE